MSLFTVDVPRRRRSAFAQLTLTEWKLLRREPLSLIWGVAFPMVLFAVMGEFSSGPDPSLGGLRLVDTYEPILIAFVAASFAVQTLPGAFAAHRERGVLRRLAVTPVGPVRVLAAQLIVNLGVVVAATGGIIAVGRLVFDVPLPAIAAGFVLSLLLAVFSLLALGLLIASVAPSGRAAGAVGAIVFFPMMFFAGLWIPRATMPSALRQVSDYTPLGATVRALQDTMFGQWPPASASLVLAGYAVVFAAAATKFFRWT